MKHETLIQLLGNKPTQNQLANIIGITQGTLSTRIKNGTEYTENEVKKICDFYGKNLSYGATDCITVEHIHINPSCGAGTIVMEEADVTPVKIGREIIKNLWNSKPEDLKIFKASGDSMEETITDNDLLLINIAKTDFRNGGIFLLTINNDWYIKRLRLRITGELDIISDNPKYPIETLTPNTIKELKVIGRVIKNLSKGL
jgi:hypothetical protein